MRRPRGPGGRFLTAEEIAQRQADDPNATAGSPSASGNDAQSRSGPRPTGSILPPELHHLMQSEPSGPYQAAEFGMGEETAVHAGGQPNVSRVIPLQVPGQAAPGARNGVQGEPIRFGSPAES
jgi:hypothetical protein